MFHGLSPQLSARRSPLLATHKYIYSRPLDNARPFCLLCNKEGMRSSSCLCITLAAEKGLHDPICLAS
ncbi:hypothetical protein TgHK011_003423 [Trichoderma gracile]|nr:hypothetical protein TgHK011_003423 [Trichoderma gracile]